MNRQTFSVFAIYRLRCRDLERFLCAYVFRPFTQLTFTCSVDVSAHAAALSALVETANSYRFYFGVYVRRVSRFTPIYIALIDPVRKLVVYPSLLRTVRSNWDQAFGKA